MASTYHLLCFDCRSYLSFGKVYRVSSDGSELPETTMDGVYDSQQKRWRTRDEFFGRVVEGFLIRHRNHEIRFVPEGVDELLDTPTTCVNALDAENVVSPRDDNVDAARELANWRQRLEDEH